MVHSVPPPALGSRQPGASALAARATAASRMPRRFPPLGVPPRCHEPNAPSRHGAHAKLPCTGIAASSALLVLLAAARGCVSSARRAGFAAKEGSAGREAAFRIEFRALFSPAQRRAGVRAERTVATRRARPGGHAVPARLPCTGFSDAARALRRRPSPRSRRPGAVRCRSAPRSPSPPRDYEPNTQPGARRPRGQAVTPCPPGSRARAWGFARRRSCFSPPPARASRRPGASAVATRAATASKVVLARNRRGNGLSRAQASLPRAAAPPVKRRFRIEPRAPAPPRSVPPRGRALRTRSSKSLSTRNGTLDMNQL